MVFLWMLELGIWSFPTFGIIFALFPPWMLNANKQFTTSKEVGL